MTHGVKMYKELLYLLEKRYNEGEIDQDSYNELKSRYSEKMNTEHSVETQSKSPFIKVAGAQFFSEDSMTVAGASKISGGKFDRDIRMAGASKISGDIECNNIKSSGSLKIDGNVLTNGSIRTSGSFKVKGNAESKEDMSFSGSAKIEGCVTTEGNFKSSGSCKSGTNVQVSKNLNSSGSFYAKGNVNVREQVELEGRTTIEGNLIGKDVIISAKRTAFEKMFKRTELSEIKGTVLAHNVVDIEDCVVEGNVKGSVVKLGPDVVIEGTVYYVEDLLVTGDVKLKQKAVKITQEELIL